MKSKNLNTGFIGLLMLLIGVALISLFLARTDLFSGKKGSKSIIEQDLDALNQAKEVKILIEQNNQKSLEE
ncbi:MAG: hypothetical protein WDK96_02925 [Candidatus Paceibacterota bacterium]|jgi:hypothetical protein